MKNRCNNDNGNDNDNDDDQHRHHDNDGFNNDDDVVVKKIDKDSYMLCSPCDVDVWFLHVSPW